MMKEDIRKIDEESQVEIDLVLGQEQLTYSFFSEHLRTFVFMRYSLVPSDCEETDDLDELTLISLSKSMKMSKDLVAEYEAGQNCDGATSATVKRSLLLMKIQRAFSVELSLQEPDGHRYPGRPCAYRVEASSRIGRKLLKQAAFRASAFRRICADARGFTCGSGGSARGLRRSCRRSS